MSYNVIDKQGVDAVTIKGSKILWGMSARWRPNIVDIPSMLLWLRPDELVTAGVMASWTDNSGQNNHAIQATEANKPTVTLNHLNGYAGVQFLDATDIMATTNAIVGEPLTIFLVLKYNTQTETYTSFYRGNTTNGFSWGSTSASGLHNIGQRGVANYAAATTALTAGNTYILGVTYAANGDWVYYNNGTADGSGTNAATMATQIAEIASGFIVDYYEVIVCNTVLSATARQQIEGYLQAKYFGIEGKLSSGHPYFRMIP